MGELVENRGLYSAVHLRGDILRVTADNQTVREKTAERKMGAPIRARGLFARGSVGMSILMYGIGFALVIFAAIFLISRTMVKTEAEENTRNVTATIQRDIGELKKSLDILGKAIAQGNPERNPGFYETLGREDAIRDVLWMSNSNWIYRKTGDARFKQFAFTARGLPDVEKLRRRVANLSPGQIIFVEGVEGYEAARMAKDAEVPIYALMPLHIAMATDAYSPSATTTTNVMVARIDIARLSGFIFLKGRSGITAAKLLDARSDNEFAHFRYVAEGENAENMFSQHPRHTLEAGSSLWKIVYTTNPGRTSRLLLFLPFILLVVMTGAALMSARLIERKQQNEEKLAEITKVLEGTSLELKTKMNEREQLMIALRKSDREHRAVMNAVSDIIFEADEKGRLVFLNETWKRTTGLDVEVGLKNALFDYIEPRDRVKQKEMFGEMVSGRRQAYRVETTMMFDNGVVKPVEISFSMMRLAEDKTIRVVGTISDVEQRRKAEAALREAEQKYRAIVENAISGIYQTTPDGRFISANPALAEILGYESPTALIRDVGNIGEQVYVDTKNRADFVTQMEQEGIVSGLENQMRRRDGSMIWIMENARAIKDAYGKISYFEGSITDITVRRKMEEELREAKMLAELSSRSKMEFLANMSHELRTPLNAIIGFSEIIKDEIMGPLGEESYKEYARDIFESGHHLLKIISEILELSRIETGSRLLNESNIKVSKIVKSCMTIVGNKIEAAQISVDINLPTDLPEILVEELAIKQILLNVIGNAIKFTPRNGKISIGAIYDEASGEVIIDVTDTGIGMNDEQLARAMRPFGQVETSFDQQKTGVGLGLTIVNALARLHEARFQLESEKDKGTRAFLIIPKKRVLVAKAAPQVTG